MKSRIDKIGEIAVYAIKSKRKKHLIKFEKELKEAGYSGVISNEAARAMPEKIKFGSGYVKVFGWIVLYHNTETGDKKYAFRDTPGSSAKVVSISEMRNILKKEK